jgi:uncharacterized membrane protein
MAFCATCGAQVEGRFCAKCGSAVGAGAPPPAGAGQQAPMQAPMQATMPAAAPMADNMAAALCYVLGLITGIIFLVLAPYNKNPTIRFHAFQSIFLCIACVIVSWILSFVFIAMHMWELLFVITIIRFVMFLFWLFMILQAYQGKTVVLPIIGPIAQQQSRV